MVMMTTRILIVDEHTLFCQGMVRLLKSIPEIRAVASATTLECAEDVAGGFRPDVILLSPTLGSVNPLEVTRRLKRSSPGSRIIWLDDRLRHVHIRGAIDAGVHGYWTKDAVFADLVQAIRDAAAGHLSFCPKVQKYLLATPEGLRPNPTQTISAVDKLTPRELEIFMLLAAGITVRGCAERLGLAVSTVDNHKVRLMRKLQVHKAVELTWIAVHEGLVAASV
ncbi:MAG: response regulator transcription factor [Planctomycetia bacterium]|nr:response regulator transcription factor [Planctomycetia bacterium]